MAAPIANWEGETMLECFLRNTIADHKPRKTTGNVACETMGTVMTIQSSEYLDSIFRKLSVEGFSSAPICRGTELVGQLTLLDLVRHVNGLFFGTSKDDWVDWWEKQISFQLTPASHIVPLIEESRINIPIMNKSFTSFSALEMMARNRNHQILQMDDQGQLCGILTQSMLISFIRQCKRKWGENFRTLRVADFVGIKRRRKLVTVKEDDLAINAFLKMDESEIHGLPIVDRNGTLTGCISVRDLKGCGTDGSKFARLYQTVNIFKATILEERKNLAPYTHYSRKKVPDSAVFVHPQSTMEDVIDRMDDGNLHRVFICTQDSCDEGRPKPIGVISQSDVLRQALECMIAEASSLGKASGVDTDFATRTAARSSPRQAQRKVAPQGRSPSKISPTKRSIPID